MLKSDKVFSSFSTADMEQAKDFYQNTLGLKTVETEMGILELHAGAHNPVIIYPKGKDHVAANFTVLNFPVNDIEKVVSQLTDKGVQFEQYDAPIKTDEKGICRSDQGPAIAWFKDPSGNIISILEEG